MTEGMQKIGVRHRGRKPLAVTLKGIGYVVLIAAAVTTLFPYAWMVLSSFKTGIEISTYPERFFSATPSFTAYSDAFRRLDLWTGVKNTLIIEVFGTLVFPMVSALGAFSFSKMKLPCKQALLLILLSSMMIPFAVTMLPLFQLWQSFGLIGTLYPLLLPYLCGGVTCTFFLIQYMQGVPNDLFESAKIDGLGYFGQFVRIMVPLAMPAVITQMLFMFVGVWNDYLAPSIYLDTPEVKTVQLKLLSLQMQQNNLMDMNIVMAGSVLSSIPMLAIFLSFQRFFVESLAVTGMKL